MRIGFCVPMNDRWSAAIAGIEPELKDKAVLVKGIQETMDVFDTLDAVVANPLDVSYFEQTDRLKALFVPCRHKPFASRAAPSAWCLGV